MECEHCKNTFKTLSSLNYHKNNAKYCLSKQNKVNEDLICKDCKKHFSSKHWFNEHKCYASVKNIKSSNESLEKENTELKTINRMLESQLKTQQDKYESQISEYKEQIKDLQNKLENIAMKASLKHTTYNNTTNSNNKTTVNNFIQQMQPVVEEKLKESADNLTIEHIKKGADGFAEFALQFPLKDKMVCTDFSRKKVKFKNEEGSLVTDIEMKTLAKKFFNSIKEKNQQLTHEYTDQQKEKWGEDEEIMNIVVKILDYKTFVDYAAEGKKTDFQDDFVKQICIKSVKD